MAITVQMHKPNFRNKSEIGRLLQVWKMAKAFGKRNKIDNRWIVYFEVRL